MSEREVQGGGCIAQRRQAERCAQAEAAGEMRSLRGRCYQGRPRRTARDHRTSHRWRRCCSAPSQPKLSSACTVWLLRKAQHRTHARPAQHASTLGGARYGHGHLAALDTNVADKAELFHLRRRRLQAGTNAVHSPIRHRRARRVSSNRAQMTAPHANGASAAGARAHVRLPDCALSPGARPTPRGG